MEQAKSQKSPLARIWELGEKQHGGLIRTVISVVIGVLFGIAPYITVTKIIVGIAGNERQLSYYLLWCGIGLGGYALKTLLYNLALSMSHEATFSILKEIRQRILAKLPTLPLGTVVDMSGGRLKQIIVDQVDSMETTLVHLLPEMTSNLLGPVCVLVYLFILDWRSEKRMAGSKHYGCPEIVAAYCHADDVCYGNMHPKVIWGRTKMLGTGGDCCDFRIIVKG